MCLGTTLGRKRTFRRPLPLSVTVQHGYLSQCQPDHRSAKMFLWISSLKGGFYLMDRESDHGEEGFWARK